MLEREVKLGAKPDFRLPELSGVVAGAHASPIEDLRLETTYYDTPDFRLARWGCSLRLREGEGWTVKLPQSAPARDGALVRHELTFPPGGRRPPEAATSLLMAYIRRSALVPVATLSTVRHRQQLRNATGRLVAEVVDDEVSVIDGLRVANRFRQLEVELGEAGDEAVLPALLQRLRAAGAGASDPTPKLLLAVGRRAREPAEVSAGDLAESASTGEVIRHAIGQAVAALFTHDPGVRLGDDPEDIHKARVATRRLRSELRTFRPMVDAAWAEPLREELRWLAGGLGEVRDKQVLAGRLRTRAAELAEADHQMAMALADQLEAESQERRGRLVLEMRSDRYVDLLDRLIVAARTPVLLPDAERPATDALPELARRDWRRLQRAVESLAEVPADSELHGVRIAAKRARYAADAAALVVGRRAEAFADAAAALQEVLGEHQDSVTAQGWLRDAAGGDHAFVAGELCAVERYAAQSARQKWPGTWKKLDRKRLRRWMI